MELHSATTALTLLRGGAGQTPSPVAVKPDASPFDQGVTFKKAERAEQVRFYGPPTTDGWQDEPPEELVNVIPEAKAARVRCDAISEKCFRGETGPFDPELGLMTGQKKGFDYSYRGTPFQYPGAFGKLADFGADGSITLYGSDGTAYSAADYNAANVDGGIPELFNSELERTDPGVRWRGGDTVTVQRS